MRLHAENPDLSYEELIDLAMRTPSTRAVDPNKPRYLYQCRQCEEDVWVDQEQHDSYQYYRTHTDEIGIRTPKCGDCYL